MSKIKIVAVSYYNTLPMLYGLEHSDFVKQNCELILNYPSECARSLLENRCDIALVPVGIIPQLKEYHIVSDYCIGAEDKVRSVILASDSPLPQINRILLDYQSATSVRLVKVLAENYWHISPEWVQSKAGYENEIAADTAGVVIGDRCFTIKPHTHVYDLAEEWIKFTGLPFVFAAWLSSKPIDNDLQQSFNQALGIGVHNIPAVIDFYHHRFIKEFNPMEYYTQNISYNLTERKREGMKRFVNYLSHC